ncbi:MAG TPA: HAMP domain-containing sensor histidine kinase [Thermoanaerobaculia bacterium]|nr:HAMP domain-containing sensor histidine kinase [Thermoanaerobaculia bacterium]
MLHEFITENRQEIINRCRTKVSARKIPPPSPSELTEGIPLFLDQLVEILRLHTASSPSLRKDATKHGEDLLGLGYTSGQVVHDYGDVCQSITELAIERKAPISTDDFRVLNRCLDDAIANAVEEFGKRRDVKVSENETERVAIFAHELRNHLASATLAYEALKSGSVGVDGSTSALLERSLSRLNRFVEQAIVESRLNSGMHDRERIPVAEVIDEVEGFAVMEAKARGLRFTNVKIESDVAVNGDRQILESIVGNLVQNALKFTRPNGSVLLRSWADDGHVQIAVEDECGGLPPGDPNTLFLPFERRGRNRTGLGLGLAISKRGAEANGGTLQVRDLPGKGCIFTVELPRAVQAAG